MSKQSSSMKFRELPELARRICAKTGAPPRLVTHLTIVHDAAATICEALDACGSALACDRELVLGGAALHDIGKTLHPNELNGPGSLHEDAGERLLLSEGVSVGVARIARTHGQWRTEAKPCLEDLLVALADKAWRGVRDERLETAIAGLLCASLSIQPWEAFSALDRIIRTITANADARLRASMRAP